MADTSQVIETPCYLAVRTIASPSALEILHRWICTSTTFASKIIFEIATVSAHTGIAGVSVPLAQTLDDCEAFLRGDFDKVAEEACYMQGAMARGDT